MRPKQLSACLVCSDAAVGINFGVPTCAPCKAFFRRNAVKLGKIDFVCQEDGDCPVTYQSRRICNCCRLAKCFRVGMQKELIRSEAERAARKELVQRNRQQRRQLPTQPSRNLIQPTSALRSMCEQSESLSQRDRILISNIFHAYERTCLASKTSQVGELAHSSVDLPLHTFFNRCSTHHVSLIEYFKLIPEFHQLSINDKIRLMRNHFLLNLSINLSILHPGIPTIVNTSAFHIFDSNITSHVLRAIHSVQAYVCDPILLKLLLIVVTLSSAINRRCTRIDADGIYDNSSAIYTAQNIYAELLWRYVASRAPSERQAVQFFNKLILFLLLLQSATLRVDDHVSSLLTEIERMEPLMQNMWYLPEKNSINANDIAHL